MVVRAFASGSKGNCLGFRADGRLYLVDLGLSCGDLKKRLAACGLSPDEVAGVFFTHNHVDHFRGLEVFHRRYPNVPLYANGETADALARESHVEDGWQVFETATPFALDSLSVTTFSIPHDATDPVGYLFDDRGTRLFVGTDMGLVTLPAKEALARATCAVLESNHDPELLARSDRPVSLKQRIAGRCGHLSNAQAADAIRETAPAALRVLLLAHLSSSCNAPYLALESMQRALADIRRTDITLAALAQDAPGDRYEF